MAFAMSVFQTVKKGFLFDKGVSKNYSYKNPRFKFSGFQMRIFNNNSHHWIINGIPQQTHYHNC